MEFELINKSIFFPKHGILVFGDLHLGYELMLKLQGKDNGITQLKETKEEIQKTIQELKSKNYQLNKIILLGDLKHDFRFDKSGLEEVEELFKFLEKYVPKEKIIWVKGNHDKFNLKNKEKIKFYIEEKIAFTHGDKSYNEILDKKIKTIVIGHIHPTTIIEEKECKCHLIGKWNNKKMIILPSFLHLIPGTLIDENYKEKERYSIVSKEYLVNLKKYPVMN